jgi:hypothetical protein
MVMKHLNVIGITPGETTGWAVLTIPRGSIFGDDDPDIIEWDYGRFTGTAELQAVALARLAREIQSLEFKTGPALIIEAVPFDLDDPDSMVAVYVGAMLRLLRHQKQVGDSTLTFQPMDIIFSDATTDARMKKLGLYIPDRDEINDAARHALTALRRARDDLDFAKSLWPYPPGWDMRNISPRPDYEYVED